MEKCVIVCLTANYYFAINEKALASFLYAPNTQFRYYFQYNRIYSFV